MVMARANLPHVASDDAFERAQDSTLSHVAEHTRRYIESDGQDGHLWNGIPTLVLLSRGRRSGEPRRNALIYGRDDDAYVVVGSRGGHRNHPHWYLNLIEEPRASVQVGWERFGVIARTAVSAERRRLWKVMVDIFPTYDEYRQKTTREIPIVVLSRAPEQAGQ
jgi:deazaflavin-dependent oxidoreductase (nitroreductase family)